MYIYIEYEQQKGYDTKERDNLKSSNWNLKYFVKQAIFLCVCVSDKTFYERPFI